MTTSSKKAAVSVVAIAAFDAGRSDGNIIDAIKLAIKNGATTAEVATDFRAGRIADLIFKRAGKATVSITERDKAIKRGFAIVAACEPGRTPKAGQAMRSEEDQSLFEPTKRWWSRTGRDAGVIKPRNVAPRTPEGDKAPPKKNPPKNAPKAPPKAKTPEAAMTSVQNMLHMLATFCAKHVKLLPAEVTAKCNGLSVEVDKLATSK